MTTIITQEGFEVSTTPQAQFARERLTKRIEEGRAAGQNVLAKIQADAPQDAIVRANAFSFVPTAGGEGAINVGIQFGQNGSELTLHPHAFSQVHLGGRLAEEIEYSARTLQLDTQATESATRDHVRALLSPAKINAGLEVIRRADEKKIDWAHAKTKLAKQLLKSELKAVQDAFESQDVINLPPGNSEWRLSNAVSWIAGHTDDVDRRLELERVAGQFFGAEKKVA